jgi:uncharacterized protein (UPF0261 family)
MPVSLKPQAPVLVVASVETKSEEVDDLVNRISRYGHRCQIIDISLNSGGKHLDGSGKMAAMHHCAKTANSQIRKSLASGAQVVVGIGGGTGAQIIGEAISDLPFALPKILINTMASDLRPDTADNSVIIIPSVSDLAGMNPTLRQVFENAAAVVSGLVKAATYHPHISTSPTIGMTTLGSTSLAGDRTKNLLTQAGYETTAFHANGYGGKAFSRWCECGAFSGVLDLTTHEVTRLLFDPVSNVPRNRFRAAARAGLPQVVLPGGLNFISRGPLESLPASELSKPHYCHSYNFTHIGLTADQMRQAATFLLDELTAVSTPTIVIVPMGGFSSEDRPDGAIEHPALRDIFLKTAQKYVSDLFEIRAVDGHLQDEETTRLAANSMVALLEQTCTRPQAADAHIRARTKLMLAKNL